MKSCQLVLNNLHTIIFVKCQSSPSSAATSHLHLYHFIINSLEANCCWCSSSSEKSFNDNDDEKVIFFYKNNSTSLSTFLSYSYAFSWSHFNFTFTSFILFFKNDLLSSLVNTQWTVKRWEKFLIFFEIELKNNFQHIIFICIIFFQVLFSILCWRTHISLLNFFHPRWYQKFIQHKNLCLICINISSSRSSKRRKIFTRW